MTTGELGADERGTDNAFRQQRLKAWQPILTPKTVLPLFFSIGLLFALFGGLLIWANSQVQEIILDYSQCKQDAPPCSERPAAMPSGSYTSFFRNATAKSQEPSWCTDTTPINYNGTTNVTTTQCHVYFYIPDDLAPPVLLYYQLTNFYQNHRRYVQSFDQDQLQGQARSNDSIAHSDCDPLQQETFTDANNNTYKKPYYPCGLIANSLFNDTFLPPRLLAVAGSADAGTTPYNMTRKGIAWSSDAKLYGATQYQYGEVVPPPNWREKYPEYSADVHPFPDLTEWEEFQVWMRTAGLPTFSKLALRNDNETMKAGPYEIVVYDCECVDGFLARLPCR